MSARHTLSLAALLAVCLGLAACGSKPPVPGWQLDAVGALERYPSALFSGADRAAAAEFRRAREALSATGDASLVARAELTRCAAQVAQLQFEACTGFEALRADAGEAERAYADYLAGVPLDARRIASLPPQHRAVAAAAPEAAMQALRSIDEPFSRLVAAGVLLRAGRASPEVAPLATETAAAQGWRRPLLAWLGVQLRGAQQAGRTEEAQRLRRRMDLVSPPR